jgi:hypothetical protein
MAVVFKRSTQGPSRRRRWVPVAALAVGLVLWVAYVLVRSQLPTHLEPFDPSRAALLTPERRAAYERELFEELFYWFEPTRRYPMWHPKLFYVARERRWKEMAADGFELAHVVLRVVQPSTGRRFWMEPAFLRLEALAEQGDVGAMCLMAGLNVIGSGGKYNARRGAVARRWMERGAALGHPQCLRDWGGRLLLGVDGQPQDHRRGVAMILASIRQGYLGGTMDMSRHYMRQGVDQPGNLRKGYCWLYRYWQLVPPHIGDLTTWFRIDIDKVKPVEKRELLMEELRAMAGWEPALEECVALSEGDGA